MNREKEIKAQGLTKVESLIEGHQHIELGETTGKEPQKLQKLKLMKP